MPDATFTALDLTTIARLDELGLAPAAWWWADTLVESIVKTGPNLCISQSRMFVYRGDLRLEGPFG